MTLTAETALSLTDCSKKLGVDESVLGDHIQRHRAALRLDPQADKIGIKPEQLFELKLLLILSKKSYAAQEIEAILSFVQDLAIWRRIKSSGSNTFNRSWWVSLLATIDLFIKARQDSEDLKQLVLETGKGLDLRATGKHLTFEELAAMLRQFNFFDASWHPQGKGLTHVYRAYRSNKDQYIVDYKSGLMWQRGGSEWLIYPKAHEYVHKLNQQQFAGFTNWRLPTMEEAMSLIEPEPQAQHLHIDPLFEIGQQRIWSCDWQQRDSLAWAANFGSGEGAPFYIWVYDSCVRAVRAWK